jgi:hypothetical protein
MGREIPFPTGYSVGKPAASAPDAGRFDVLDGRRGMSILPLAWPCLLIGLPLAGARLAGQQRQRRELSQAAASIRGPVHDRIAHVSTFRFEQRCIDYGKRLACKWRSGDVGR